MTAFHEVQFPPRISYGATGGAGFRTTVITAASGYESRNSSWAASRGEWDISTGMKNLDDASDLIAFFRARRGRAYGFRFKDWTDYTATDQTLGTGTGSLKTFQLVKVYTSGLYGESRTITKPVAGTTKVYLDDVLQTSGWAIDTSTGIITFTTAPSLGVVVTADFEFDVPARFDTDTMQLNYATLNHASWSSIPIVEIRI